MRVAASIGYANGTSGSKISSEAQLVQCPANFRVLVEHLAMTARKFCDVLVFGGGPTGSTVFARVGRKCWTVTLLDNPRQSRFHIGESLRQVTCHWQTQDR